MSIKPSSETLNFFDMDLLQCEPPVHALDLQHRHPIYLMHVMWLTKRFAFVHLKFCGCFSIRTCIFCLFYTITFEKHPHQIVYYTLYFIQIKLFIIIFYQYLSHHNALSLSLIIPCLSFDPPSTLFLSHIPNPDTHTWQQIWQFFHWVFCVSFLLGLILIYFSFRFGMTFLIGFDFELGFFMNLG